MCCGPDLDLWPGGGGEFAVGTLEGTGVEVRPLVVLHVRAAVEGLHADAAGEPLGVELLTGAGRARHLAAQLTGTCDRTTHSYIQLLNRLAQHN